MDIAQLQHAIGVVVDGKWGPASRAGLVAKFTNKKAPAVTDSDIAAIAHRLGCTPKQVRAVAAVESGGSGFDNQGRPKILFERHLFHRLTGGRFSPAPFSNPVYGGYNEDSWNKLAHAAGKSPADAFSACSWGKFQVLGTHWNKLGYANSFELAYSTVQSEAAHFELLARYIETFGLLPAIRKLSTKPDDCRDFARGYNGPQYQRFSYHIKLARAMA
jgi:hypothetical protein